MTNQRTGSLMPACAEMTPGYPLAQYLEGGDSVMAMTASATENVEYDER